MSIVIETPESFFRGKLKEINEFYGKPANDLSIVYAGGLLESLVKVDRDSDEIGSSGIDLSSSLASFLDNITKKPDLAFEYFKKLGDHALILGGFFREHVKTDDDYIVAMGKTGYWNAGRLFKPLEGIFKGLAVDFPILMRFFEDLRHDKDVISPEDMDKIFNYINETGSPYIRKKFKENLGNVIYVDFMTRSRFS